jgi:hypothetical protein
MIDLDRPGEMKGETLVLRWEGIVIADGGRGRTFPAGDSRTSLHRWRSDIAVDGVSVGSRLSRIGQAQNPSA